MCSNKGRHKVTILFIISPELGSAQVVWFETEADCRFGFTRAHFDKSLEPAEREKCGSNTDTLDVEPVLNIKRRPLSGNGIDQRSQRFSGVIGQRCNVDLAGLVGPFREFSFGVATQNCLRTNDENMRLSNRSRGRLNGEIQL